MSDENKNQEEEEMVFDTSKMTADQAAAMEVAEAAREKEWREPSFAAKLFMGEFDADLMLNIEDQDPKDKEIGDEFLQKLEETLVKHLDPEKVDATGELPEGFIEKLAELGVFGMKVPAEYEGLGFSQVNYNRAATKIASYDGATATLVSAHQSIGVPNPLKMFGTPAQKKKFFPMLAKGAVSAFALTELWDPIQLK